MQGLENLDGEGILLLQKWLMRALSLSANFSKIFLEIQTFSLKKKQLKMSVQIFSHFVPDSMC